MVRTCYTLRMEFLIIFGLLSSPVIIFWLVKQALKAPEYYRLTLGTVVVMIVLAVLTSMNFGYLYALEIIDKSDTTLISLFFSLVAGLITLPLILAKAWERNWKQFSILVLLFVVNIWFGYQELWAMAALGMGI